MVKETLVILDPGHGIDVKGKCSPFLPDGRRLYEWKYAREICHRIQDRLATIGIKSVFTTNGDTEIGLSKRAEIVNNYCKKQKSVFVSVHCNAAGGGDKWINASGWEVWTTEGKTNSDKLAQCFLDVFQSLMPNKKLRGHKEKNFTVIYKTNCPSVLTENFFMDNLEDCNFLLSEGGKEKITELHVGAILKYINEIK